MKNLPYELYPIWTDWLEEQEQETNLLKFCLEYQYIFINNDFSITINNPATYINYLDYGNGLRFYMGNDEIIYFILSTYEDFGIKVSNTDTYGAIFFLGDGNYRINKN